MRTFHLVYRTGETIYSAEHLHETQKQDYCGYKREKQTASHAIWIECSFEMCDTAEGEKSGKLEKPIDIIISSLSLVELVN